MPRAVQVLAVLGLVLAAPGAQARRSPFWERAANGHRERVDDLLGRAQSQLNDQTLGERAPEAAARAEALAREALLLDPQSFPASVLLGEALARQRRGAEATAAFERARSVARTAAEESWCALRLGVERSRAGRYAEALAEYDRHIQLGGASAAAHVNSAELLMGLGRLSEAEQRYRAALRREEQSPAGRERDQGIALAGYGLAVALDRAERPEAAREAMATALAHDPRMLILEFASHGQSEVFFVPQGDVHYYRGLALSAAGRPKEAFDAFTKFVGEGHPRYRKRAEMHLLALAAAGADGKAAVTRGRLRLVASATVRAEGPIPAPLVDAALKSRPALIDGCLDEAPAGITDTVRVPVELRFDRQGQVSGVKVELGEAGRALASCLEASLAAGLRVPAPGRSLPTTARLELVLGVRR